MKLTNAMEHAVKIQLSQIQEAYADDGPVCWCPLCRADMMALSLSSLPPRYGTMHIPAVDTDSTNSTAVREEVSRALLRVERNPKHPRGNAVSTTEPVWVVNFPLEESFHVLDSLIREQKDSCGCWQCRCDMVAFALNRYPAKYGVEHQGRTHLLEEEREQMRRELSSFLNLAMNVITEIPHHKGGALSRAAAALRSAAPAVPSLEDPGLATLSSGSPA